jgi:hypothetical protein
MAGLPDAQSARFCRGSAGIERQEKAAYGTEPLQGMRTLDE